MEMNNVNLFIHQITYLPFDDVIAICQFNSKFHKYCTDSKYNTNWKLLIDNTYGGIYNYEDKLKKIWTELNIIDGIYNYIVYTQLIKYLDPITQLMIYYKQGDDTSFNHIKYTQKQRVMALFILNKLNTIQTLYPYLDMSLMPFITLLKEEEISQEEFSDILFLMIKEGNVKGVSLLLSKGADIHIYDDLPFKNAIGQKQIDVVKYLADHGATFDVNDSLILAGEYGFLDGIKFFLERGADIHYQDDAAFIIAVMNGNLDIVKYLVEQGTNVHAQDNAAIHYARLNKDGAMIKYLELVMYNYKRK